MKTVITKEIDGFKIVAGFGEPVIDPIETNKIIPGLLKDTVEENRIVAHKQSIAARSKLMAQSLDAAKAANKVGNKAKVTELNGEYQMHMGALSALMEEIKPLFDALDKKRIELTAQNAVYFEPATGEELVDDSTAQGLTKKSEELKENEVLAFDGSVIPDFKGRKYWTKTSGKWAESQIFSIGETVPAGSVLESDLTNVQKEEISIQTEMERITGLTAADKLAEFEFLKSRIAAESTALKNQLEFDGDAKASSKAQASYDLKLADLKIKYGY